MVIIHNNSAELTTKRVNSNLTNSIWKKKIPLDSDGKLTNRVPKKAT